MKRDRLLNSVLIVLTIFAVGSCLIIWPFRGYLAVARDSIRAGKPWLPLVVGIAYVVGFFVTRTVEDSFDAIFNKPPFSEIGEKTDKGPKHPAWVDHMLGPLGYLLFFVRVAVIIGLMVLLLYAGLWLVGLRMGGPAA